MIKAIGVLLTVGAVGAGVGEVCGLRLPTLEWGFELSRNVDALGWEWMTQGKTDAGEVAEVKVVFPWFGWMLTVLAFFLGLFILIKFSREGALTPITVRKIQRFKSI